MGKNRKVMVMVHPHYHPEKGKRRAPTEYDVCRAIRKIGDTLEVVAVDASLRAFDRHLARFQPDIVFNLLEEFRGEAVYDFHLISFLESLGIPYTGCNPRGLVVSRNKLWTANIARENGVCAPASSLNGVSRKNHYPLMVKLNREHASLGLTKKNVVRNSRQLKLTVRRMQMRYGGELLVQQFVPGFELSLGVWGNNKIEVFAPWQLELSGPDAIATEKLKFGGGSRRQDLIRSRSYSDKSLTSSLKKNVKILFRLLDLNGYARFDFRVDENGKPFLIDVNANPCLARDEDFVSAAKSSWSLSYEAIIDQIISLGLSYQPRK